MSNLFEFTFEMLETEYHRLKCYEIFQYIEHSRMACERSIGVAIKVNSKCIWFGVDDVKFE